jgi:hypothetical protein
MKKASFIATLALVLAVVGQSKADVYDLLTDWSDTDNPNGPWAYLEGNNPLPHVDSWQSQLGGWTMAQSGWARSENGNNRLPFWFQSNGSENFSPDWLAGDIIVHTHDDVNGVGNGLAAVTWTSPDGGTITISGAVWNGRNIGRGNDWRLYLNDQLLTSGHIESGDGHTRDQPFDLATGSGGADVLVDVPVAAGDLVRLELQRTTQPGDFVGVNLTIELVQIP